LFEFMPYGAPELQSGAARHLSRALVLGTSLVTLSFVAIGAALHGQGFELRTPDDIPVSILPPLLAPVTPRIGHPGASAVAPTRPPVTGIAKPVADAFAAPEQTIPQQVEMGAWPPAGDPDVGTGMADPAPAGAGPEVLPVLGEYQYVEVLPRPLERVQPEYPELARQAGVEGLVLVHALVGTRGRVLDVRVHERHSVPLLDDSAVAAVRRWTFTPAVTNGRAVAVWIAIPVRFSLAWSPR
jgi:protein TonB